GTISLTGAVVCSPLRSNADQLYSNISRSYLSSFSAHYGRLPQPLVIFQASPTCRLMESDHCLTTCYDKCVRPNGGSASGGGAGHDRPFARHQGRNQRRRIPLHRWTGGRSHSRAGKTGSPLARTAMSFPISRLAKS